MTRATGASAIEERAQRQLGEQLGRLRGALEAMRRHRTDAVRGNTLAREARAAEARSASPLALEPVATFTTLQSTDEVNATPTSFTPYEPSVSGGSTTQPLIGGTYDGSLGDDTLTFEFRQNRQVGDNRRLRVRVYDGGGQRLETLRFDGVPAGTPLTLDSGLTLALGSGFAVRRDTFSVDVSASVGSAVDPTKSFDGALDESPNFELGVGVSAGSFEVNGVSIDVAADDSIDSVLAKITSSTAGVTASFDAASESVVLTQRTAGSAPGITVGNDTSGFLAATKLEGAAAVPGQDAQSPLGDPIADVPALAGIQSGTFSVNGVDIAVDTAVDTLGDVLDRINNSGAGVIARLDPETLVLSLSRKDPRAELVLGDGSSGFFSGVKITPATYQAVDAVIRPRSGFRDFDGVRRDVFELRRALDALFSQNFRGVVNAGALREELRGAIAASFESAREDPSKKILRSGFGIDFDFTRDQDVARFDEALFERANEAEFGALHEFLFGEAGDAAADETGAGLIGTLLEQVEELQAGPSSGSVGAAVGRIVDLFT